MSPQVNAPPPEPVKEPKRDSQEVGQLAATLLFIYLAAIITLSVLVLLAVWPAPDGEIIGTPWGKLSVEVRYLLLVIGSAALGSSVHGLSSLVDYLGDRRLRKSWLWSYVSRVLTAVSVAIIIYMLVRGVLLSPGANVSHLNPFGIAAFAGLVGLFSNTVAAQLLRVTQSAFGRATPLEKNVDRIGALLGIATLDNYQGSICMEFRDGEGAAVQTDSAGLPLLKGGRTYRMAVWFQPGEPKRGLSERVKIEGGRDSAEVEFSLEADSESLSISPRQAPLSFAPRERSAEAAFQVSVPESTGSFEFWIHLTQKNQFVKLVSKTVTVQAKDTEPPAVLA